GTHPQHVNRRTGQYSLQELDYKHWYEYRYQSPENRAVTEPVQHEIVVLLNLLKLSWGVPDFYIFVLPIWQQLCQPYKQLFLKIFTQEFRPFMFVFDRFSC